MARIGVVGSANMDLVARARRIPAAGENVIAEQFLTVPGGKGANQAVAVARLGGEALFIGRVGADGFGERLLDGLKREGVDVSHTRALPDAASGVALIVVDPEGRHTIVVAPNANALLRPEDIRPLKDLIASMDAVLIQMEVPPETVDETVRLCREVGVRIIVDAGPPREDFPAEAFRADILTPNEDEAGRLVGRRIGDLKEAEEAGRELLSRGAGSVVLKLGARGALIVTPGECVRLPACRITPVDTTAAGDAFTAALALFTSEGKSLPDAVRLANRAGALAATRLGAQPSLPTRAEVEAFDP
jgi:ribokinase